MRPSGFRVVTAVSPRALVDIAYVVFESGRLIRRLSELYGGRPGTLGFFRLARSVLAHLAVTGAIAAGDDFVHQIVGQGLAARLSAKLGEGVVNGMMTARIGIAAMETTRPLPFAALKRPGMGDFLSALTSFTRQRKDDRATDRARSESRALARNNSGGQTAPDRRPLTNSGHGSGRSFSSPLRCRVSLDEARNPVRRPPLCRAHRRRGRPCRTRRRAPSATSKFFQSIEGAWVGPGEIVAGKYKGTKFTCSFSGPTPSSKLGMTLDGGCRVGMFTQKMSATVEHSGCGRLQGHLHGRRRRLGPRHHFRQRRRRPQGRSGDQPQAAARRHAGAAPRRRHDERHRIGARRQGDGAGDRHEPETRRRHRRRRNRPAADRKRGSATTPRHPANPSDARSLSRFRGLFDCGRSTYLERSTKKIAAGLAPGG